MSQEITNDEGDVVAVIGNDKRRWDILPRKKLEKLIVKFLEENNIYAEYGKDYEGVHQVIFPVIEDETED